MIKTKERFIEFCRRIANRTAGTPVDIVDLSAMVKRAEAQGSKDAKVVFDKSLPAELAVWLEREKPKAPAVCEHFLAELHGVKDDE